MNLHGRIMNIRQPVVNDGPMQRYSYNAGHRDARHAAAELALQADAINAQLLEALRRVRDVLNDYADVIDGSDGRQLPNSAMSAQVACSDEIEAAIKAAEGA